MSQRLPATDGTGGCDGAQRPHAAVDGLRSCRGRRAAGTSEGEGQGSWRPEGWCMGMYGVWAVWLYGVWDVWCMGHYKAGVTRRLACMAVWGAFGLPKKDFFTFFGSAYSFHTAIQATRLVTPPVYAIQPIQRIQPHTPYSHTAHTPYIPIQQPSAAHTWNR